MSTFSRLQLQADITLYQLTNLALPISLDRHDKNSDGSYTEQCTVGEQSSKLKGVQTGYEENIFCHEDNQAFEQLTPRGCAASILRGFKDQSG